MQEATVLNAVARGKNWTITFLGSRNIRHNFVTNADNIKKPEKGAKITFEPNWHDPDRVLINGIVVYTIKSLPPERAKAAAKRFMRRALTNR